MILLSYLLDLLGLRLKFTNLIVEQHYVFVHFLFIGGKLKPFVAELRLFLLKFAVEFRLGVLKRSITT